MATAVDGKMMLVLYFAVFCFSELCMGSRLYVTHAPSHVQFNDNNQPLHISELPEVISSSFGFPIKEDLEWNGLGAGSLFHRPKAQVLMNIQDAPHDTLSFHGSTNYPLLQDGDLSTESVASLVQHSASRNSPLIIDYSLDTNLFDLQSRHPDLLAHVPLTFSALRRALAQSEHAFTAEELGSLNLTKETDMLFLSEIHVLREIIKALVSRPSSIEVGVPDLYHFKVVGLRNLANEYGQQGAPQLDDAMKLVGKVAEEMTSTFKALYQGNVVVHVAVQKRGEQTVQGRSRRSLKQAPTESRYRTMQEMLNVASNYNVMFSVSFNLIFWTVLVLVITTTAVAYSMWFMDPGRDSIIYRMTSQRIKMD